MTLQSPVCAGREYSSSARRFFQFYIDFVNHNPCSAQFSVAQPFHTMSPHGVIHRLWCNWMSVGTVVIELIFCAFPMEHTETIFLYDKKLFRN
jgi:hypothetical protein